VVSRASILRLIVVGSVIHPSFGHRGLCDPSFG
jgi:hypothetical protein